MGDQEGAFVLLSDGIMQNANSVLGPSIADTVVDEFEVTQVVNALLEAHPYEVPSYHLIPVLTLE